MLKEKVGETRLVNLRNGIFAKVEFDNPTGSIKDRMAQWIIRKAFEDKVLKEGSLVIEATSGNTGISLAWLSTIYKFKLIIVMPKNMSLERKNIIRLYGAEIIEVGVNDFAHAVEVRNELVFKHNAFTTDQFSNEQNILCHSQTTGREILEQVGNDEISALVAGTGTGGTLMGIRQALIQKFPNMKTIAVEPFESAVMNGFTAGRHDIQGIGDGFIPPLVNMDLLDYAFMVKSGDAIKKALAIRKTTGYFVGVSSGANTLAAEKYIQNYHPKGVVVTIWPDNGERYLSMFEKFK